MDAAVARRRGHRRRRSWSTGNRWRRGSPVRKSARRRSQGGCWPNMQARLYRIRTASRRPLTENERPRPEGSPPWFRSYSPPSKYRKLARRFGAREHPPPQTNTLIVASSCEVGRSLYRKEDPMPWFDQAPWLVALAPFFGSVPFRIRETNRPLHRRRPGVPPRRPRAPVPLDPRHRHRRVPRVGHRAGTEVHPGVRGGRPGRHPMAERPFRGRDRVPVRNVLLPGQHDHLEMALAPSTFPRRTWSPTRCATTACSWASRSSRCRPRTSTSKARRPPT